MQDQPHVTIIESSSPKNWHLEKRQKRKTGIKTRDSEDTPDDSGDSTKARGTFRETYSLSSVYQGELSQRSPLSDEENAHINKRIILGIQAREAISSNGYHSQEQLEQLQAVINDAQLARRELVEPNLRLVVYVAKKFIGRGVPYMDLIQEGTIGLMKARDKYDPRRAQFSTLAVWWIRQAVGRAVANTGKTIRLPVNLGSDINRMKRFKMELTQALNREPTHEEIGASFAAHRVKQLQEKGEDVPPMADLQEYFTNRVGQLHDANKLEPENDNKTDSADSDRPEDEGMFSVSDGMDLDTQIFHKQIAQKIEDTRDALKGREREDFDLFIQYEGLLNGDGRVPLRVLASQLQMSPEGVRQRVEKGRSLARWHFEDILKAIRP